MTTIPTEVVQQLRCTLCGHTSSLLSKHYVRDDVPQTTIPKYRFPLEPCNGRFVLEDVEQPIHVRKRPCESCGASPDQFRWEAWGSYLDKDLVCQNCKHVVDVWDC